MRRAIPESGFTLLEVVIALTILAVGIMAVMSLFPASLAQQRVAAERTVIAALARTQLSEVRSGGAGASLSIGSIPSLQRIWAKAGSASSRKERKAAAGIMRQP